MIKPNIIYLKGDKVRKKYGTLKLTVTGAYGNSVYLQYPNGRNDCAVSADLVYWEEKEEKMSDDSLYEVKLEDGVVVLANHIGTNSSNYWVMEERGTGKIYIVKPESVTEVLPFTFSTRVNGKEIHFLGEPDKVKVGDVLIHMSSADTMQMVLVIAVNTKSKGARKFKGLRVNTSEF